MVDLAMKVAKVTADIKTAATAPGLRRDAIGLREVLFQSITGMAPDAPRARTLPRDPRRADRPRHAHPPRGGGLARAPAHLRGQRQARGDQPRDRRAHPPAPGQGPRGVDRARRRPAEPRPPLPHRARETGARAWLRCGSSAKSPARCYGLPGSASNTRT